MINKAIELLIESLQNKEISIEDFDIQYQELTMIEIDKCLSMDLASIPRHEPWSMELWLRYIKQDNTIFWDSSRGGHAPIITEKSNLQIIDIKKDD